MIDGEVIAEFVITDDPSLLISTLPVHSPAFFPNLSRAFPVLAVASTGSRVSAQNKIGHPAEYRFPY